MGGEPCFGQICLNNMGPYQGEPVPGMTSWYGPVGRRWHRDGGARLMWREHPLRIGYMRLQVYLTDVDETTHSFAISPEAIDQELLSKEDQLARGGIRDLQGRAGAAILFNISSLHTVCIRPTQAERKTVGIYYGHRHREYHSDHTYIPPSLWRDHPDGEVRGFYGVLNGMTRTYLERTAGRGGFPRTRGGSRRERGAGDHHLDEWHSAGEAVRPLTGTCPAAVAPPGTWRRA